jgi:hypothetical protein
VSFKNADLGLLTMIIQGSIYDGLFIFLGRGKHEETY